MTQQLDGQPVRVGRSTAVQWMAKFAGMALSLASLVVVAHRLGSQEYGRLTLVTAYFSFVVVLADWGFPATLAREFSHDGPVEPDLLSSLVLGRLAASLGIYLAALGGFVVLVGQGRRTAEAAAILLVALVPASVASTVTTVLQADLRLHVAAAYELLARCGGFVATVAVVMAGGGVRSVVAVQVGVYAVNSLLVLGVVRRRSRIAWRFDSRLFTRSVRQSAPLGLAMVLNAVYYRVDALMVGSISGLAAAGEYGAAYRVMDSVLALPSILASVLFPLLVRCSGDLVRFRRLASGALAAAQLVMVPFVVVGLAAAPPVMRLVGGSDFASGGDSLKLLMFAGLVSAADIVLGLSLIAINRNRQALWLNAAALGVNVVLNLVFIPRWGAPGAAAATLASESAVAVVALILLNRWAGGSAGAIRSTTRLIPLAACFAVFLGSRELLPPLAVALLSGLSFGWAALEISGMSWREAGAAMRAPSPALRRGLAGLR